MLEVIMEGQTGWIKAFLNNIINKYYIGILHF